MLEIKEHRSLINLCLDLVELDLKDPANAEFVAQRFNQLAEKVDSYVALDKFADQQIDAINAEIERLSQMKKRFEDVQERLRDRAMVALETMNVKQLKSQTGHQMAIRTSESIEVFDISRLPDWAVKTTVSKVPDKTAIKVAIKDGDKIDGARLVKKDYVVLK